jgi:hypothetical protein
MKKLVTFYRRKTGRRPDPAAVEFEEQGQKQPAKRSGL